MRTISLLLLLLGFLFMNLPGYGQRINLSQKNISLKKAFDNIMMQSGYSIMYVDAPYRFTAKKVTLSIHDATLSEALAQCLKTEPGFTFFIDPVTAVIEITSKEASRNRAGGTERTELVKGKVVNEKGETLNGVTVTVKGTRDMTATNQQGEFRLKLVDKNITLTLTGVNIETYEAALKGRSEILLSVKTKVDIENEVVVTGYQVIPRERATGSFVRINNELYNRKINPDILSRLDGTASGVLFDNRNKPPNIQIHGLYTLTESISQPLIVVDNFIYEGNINNLNPLDIESVTILKDAAATSIWGAKAGNGVIVINMKKGAYNQKPALSFNSNFLVVKKPDLSTIPDISASDYIDLEKFLFDKGAFDAEISNIFRPLTPAIEILLKQRNGQLTGEQVNAQLDALRKIDVRPEFEKYIYRNALLQQYAASVNGGNSKSKYFLSAGYDRNKDNLRGNDYHKLTLRADNTWQLFKRLQVRVGAGYTHTLSNGNSPGGYGQYQLSDTRLPLYSQLADAQGNPLPINHIYQGAYTDTVGGGKLLDWKYRPLQQLAYNNNTFTTNAFAGDLDFKYDLTRVLSLSMKYRSQSAVDRKIEDNNTQTFFTRNLINNYTQINGNEVSYAIPYGSIIDRTSNHLHSNAVRGQLDYNNKWGDGHQLSGIAGAELQSTNTTLRADRKYAGDVDHTIEYPLLTTGDMATIPQITADTGRSVTHFLSWYGNAAYTFKERYTVSASARKDASNLFGAKTNSKQIPLWSVGSLWKISEETFYKFSFLPQLTLRSTYGFSGNVNNALSALTTISKYSSVSQFTNIPYSSIQNLPNPELRWEKIGQLNIGVDFKSKNDRIGGGIDYYRKRSVDVLAARLLDPTVGTPSQITNSANLKGGGWDVVLNTTNLNSVSFAWTTNFLFSHVHYKVSRYLFPEDADKGYVSNGGTITPIVGYNPYLIVSYKWGGLDPSTGDPRGFFSKDTSTDYNSITSSTPFADQVIHGSALPAYFGSIINSFSWKFFSISANIKYKFGYYFRRPTINYNALLSNLSAHPDYLKRWKQSGDEKYTTVPSFIYPNPNTNRDTFYANSEVTVEKGDHIRLDDIRLDYMVDKSAWKKMPFKQVQLYSYVTNLNVLIWKATKSGLDPDYISGLRPSRSIAIGLKADF